MLRKCAAAAALTAVLAVNPTRVVAQDTRTIVANATKAMGAGDVKTLQFSATGSSAGIGQNTSPTAGWPTVRVKSYVRDLDFSAMASRTQIVRVQGGADQAQTQVATPGSPWASRFGYWLTPFGFLEGAATNNAVAKTETVDGSKYTVLTFTLGNKYKVAGYINEQNLVERVQTWVDNDVLGDMLAEAWFSGYKDFGGVKFPSLIVEKQGGFPVAILAVSDVKANVPVSIPAVPNAAPAATAVSVQTEKVGDGVFYLKGGTHHSVAVEFADYALVIEGPQNEQRSLAVIAEVKKLIPNKPIRYVVNTHHHFDHSGGLRTYVDEGATIVTSEVNKNFYQAAFTAPRTLNPDRLARSQKKPLIETVGDKKVLTDGTRTLELHLTKSSAHNDGLLMAYLPKEKIIVEVDVYTPPTAGTAAQPVNPNTVNLVDNLEKLKLDFETVLPLHGPGKASRTDLYAAIRKPMPSMSQILAPAPAPAKAGARTAAPPPSVDARQILETSCTGCHNLARVQNLKLNQAEWRAMVDKMKDRGAEVSESDTTVLVDYLVKTYGSKK